VGRDLRRAQEQRAHPPARPQGPLEAFKGIVALEDNSGIVVTGSFAAAQSAAVSAPALLMAYVRDPIASTSALNLLPAREGANVVLLRPYDKVVWERTNKFDGVQFAAFSQVTADLLTGSGRMPEEGEALIEWLDQGDGDRWMVGSRREIAVGDAIAGNGPG
jgi:hypothetical protein